MDQRRYDIDYLRVVAIGLLIVYHAAIPFQPWGGLIGFVKNHEALTWIWYPLSLLNMWRIPILFFVSGIGVHFSMRSRTVKQVLLERYQRILTPFLFGVFAIVPLQLLIRQIYYGVDIMYKPEQSHLWFLLNIFIYTVVVVPIWFYLKKNTNGKIEKVVSNAPFPIIVLVSLILFVFEAYLVKPEMYSLYAYTVHGYALGFVSFLMGFLIAKQPSTFWQEFKVWKWIFLSLASILFTIRIVIFELNAPYYLSAVESVSWIFCVFGFFNEYGNRKGKVLSYLSKAAYPVYILHMMVQFFISLIIFPLQISVYLKLVVLILGTFILSTALYHFLIRPFKFIRPLFGVKTK